MKVVTKTEILLTRKETNKIDEAHDILLHLLGELEEAGVDETNNVFSLLVRVEGGLEEFLHHHIDGVDNTPEKQPPLMKPKDNSALTKKER